MQGAYSSNLVLIFSFVRAAFMQVTDIILMKQKSNQDYLNMHLESFINDNILFSLNHILPGVYFENLYY